MTQERKTSAPWFAALTYFLVAAVAAPLIIGLLATPSIIFLARFGVSVAWAASFLINIIAVWLGVMFSARFILKNFTISAPNKVVGYATIFYFLYFLLQVAPALFTGIGVENIPYSVGFGLFGLFVFYVASKKFVKVTPEVSISEQEPQIL